MYFYSIDNYDYSVTLIHEKEFTEDEFVSICTSAEKSKFGGYSQHRIIEKLVNEHGFAVINEDKLTASFNIDDD